jgi:hypothetical protein
MLMLAGVEVDVRGRLGALRPVCHGPAAASRPVISRNSEALGQAEAR